MTVVVALAPISFPITFPISNIRRTAAVAIASLAMCSTALAHPGHGESHGEMGFVEGIVHLLSQPDHLLMPCCARVRLPRWCAIAR